MLFAIFVCSSKPTIIHCVLEEFAFMYGKLPAELSLSFFHAGQLSANKRMLINLPYQHDTNDS